MYRRGNTFCILMDYKWMILGKENKAEDDYQSEHSHGENTWMQPQVVLKKPILAEKCCREIINGILSAFTNCVECY